MSTIHLLARQGDLEGLKTFLRTADKEAVNTPDRRGYTPLMHAAMSSSAGLEIVQLLLQHGATANQEFIDGLEQPCTAMVCALRGGDPGKVLALLEAGAKLRYKSPGNGDALLQALHGRYLQRDSYLLDLLRLLVARGIELNNISDHAESALRVLSHVGRFDAVALLLQAGADPSQLDWTPLMQAVALGALDDVEAAIDRGEALETVDWWKRTPWLIAILSGDVKKAELLEKRGANLNARGRCGQPPMHYATEGRHPGMLRHLLSLGLEVDQTDEFGGTALFEAVELSDDECLEILLSAGANVDHEYNGRPLDRACDRQTILHLLEAGADPQYLSNEGRRLLVGLPPDADEELLTCSRPEFERDRTRRFGSRNPEPMDCPFWISMIRAGISGYAGNEHFSGPSSCDGTPVWCAQRFGQSVTLLPDGRAIRIAGEHEDNYDPDFCIYNDVFVHEPGGAIHVYGYPESVFPPTDFHTATLVGDVIYIIGSLGYPDTRKFGETSVFRLDTHTLHIERVATSGNSPGWLYRHRAIRRGGEIEVSGGLIAALHDGRETHLEMSGRFVLDLGTLEWRQTSAMQARA